MNKKTAYDKAYFIAKFEAIPDELWCCHSFQVGLQCCALGHCGERYDNDSPEEAVALTSLFGGSMISVSCINDDKNSNYSQSTPKERILAALRDLP